MAQANRKASLKSNKIIVDDLETKEKLLEIGSLKSETMRETISRLVSKEHELVKRNGAN